MNHSLPSDHDFNANDVVYPENQNFAPVSTLPTSSETPMGTVASDGDPRGIDESSRDLLMAQLRLGSQELPKRQFLRQTTIVAASIVTLFYIVFRAWFTLNLVGPFAIGFSLVLLVAESYGALLLLAYFFQIWRLDEPAIKPPIPGRSVDVFVPTYNEDVSLLRGTLKACIDMDYPHATHVLDDGNRPEVKELAESLGVHYIVRSEHVDAKAGNLNHAMQVTDGEFIVILDADHVPLRHFLTRLIGYFEDEEMGFVQAPHTTYNFDNFLGRWKADSRVYWEDVHIFFKAVQLGKNRWNAACFCGSAAMFRRKALEDVGGLATETITEDLHTGLRIHARGWKSLAVSEQLVAGLAPEDSVTYNQQRLRWGEGNLSVAAYDNPLTTKGLSLAQRINYTASILNWSFGPARMIMYLTPLVMLFTGIAPVKDIGPIYFVVVAAYLATVGLAVKAASNGCGHVLGIEMAMMGAFFVHVRALFRATFLRRWQRFVVTSKQSGRRTSQMLGVLPQTMILAFGLAAILWASLKIGLGLSGDYLGLAIGSGLALYHAALGTMIVLQGIRTNSDRIAWRHPAKLLAEYSTAGLANRETVQKAVVLDFNEYGCRFVTNRPIHDASEIEMQIHSPVQSATVTGSVVGCTEARTREKYQPVGWVHRVVFDSPTPEQACSLWTIALQYVVPRITGRYRLRSSWRESLPGRILAFFHVIRNTPRIALPVPVEVETIEQNSTTQEAVTDVISEDRVWITLNHILLKGSDVVLQIQLPNHETFSCTARVGSISTSRIGAAIVHRHQFEISDNDAAAKQSLEEFVRQARVNDWPRAVRLWEPRSGRCVRIDKALVLAVGIVGILIGTGFAFRGYYGGDLLLLSASRGDSLSREQAEQASEIVEANATSRFTPPQRLLRSYETAVVLGNDEQAAAVADRLATAIPDRKHDWLLTRARHLVQNGQFQEADPVFQQLLSQENRMAFPPPQRVRLYVEAARNAINLRNIEQAAELFEKAMDLESRNTVLLKEFVGILASSGRLDMALQLLEQFEPTDDILRIRASLYEMAGQEDKAVPIMEELLRRYPDDLATLQRLAEIALAGEDFDRAVRYYERLIEKLPTDDNSQNYLGPALVATARRAVSNRDYEVAVDAFERAIAVDPSEALRAEFAGVLATVDRVPEAVELLRSSQAPASRLQLASFLEMLGRHDEALQIYETLQVPESDVPAIMRKMASSFEAVGRPEAALGLLRELHRRGDADPQDSEQLARILVALGYHDDALSHFRRLGNVLPDDKNHWTNYVAAVAAANELTDTDRKNINHVYGIYLERGFTGLDQKEFERLGDALRKLDQLEQASHALRAGVQAFPNSRYMRLRLADTLQQLGQHAEAEQHYRYLLEVRPGR